MIICKNLKKTYGKTTIFNDFSYLFQDTGLYILYGVSGCGKTTLLQILLGIESFDDGLIIYNSDEYKNKVHFHKIQDEVAYISQDSYFIDFLTIEENLLLQSKKTKNKIKDMMKLFNLDSLMTKFPQQLSGGERQRVSIIGSLLCGKRIFLLDEPTSSLDKENKNLFYDVLRKVSENCLIICASHDETIFNLKCEVINFNKIDNYKIFNYNKKEKVTDFLEKKRKKKHEIKAIFNSLFKQLYRKEKAICIIFILCFSFVFLLLFSCTDYHKKLISSLINNHNLNGSLVFCSVKNKDYCKSIFEVYGATEYVYDYVRNIPDETDKTNFVSDDEYEMGILSLPSNKSNIKDFDKMLLYGSYYNHEKQIIIGYNKAIELSNILNVSIEELINKEIIFYLPNGKEKFTICGVLKEISDRDIIYLKALLGQYDFDNYYFVNGNYNFQYLYDNYLGVSEKNNMFPSVAFTVYFANSKDFTNSLIKIEDPVNNFVEYSNNNTFIQYVCLFVSLSFVTLGMIFYYQIHKTRISYTEHNYSIFEYFGYKNKSVLIATSLYFVTQIILISIISSLIAGILSYIINFIIIDNQILPYPLFVFSKEWILSFILLVFILAIVESLLLNRNRKNKGWFYLIKEKSDLI